LSDAVRYKPAGDQALTVEFGAAISPAVNQRVRACFWQLEQKAVRGIKEIIPTYCSLLIIYDPLVMTADSLTAVVEGCLADLTGVKVPEPQVTLIPTLYGGEYGPDLEMVAEHSGLTPAEVIELHSGQDYLIYMLGFTPGFPYLGGMPEQLATPRLSSPRTRIPAGSVGIAGRQTGVYPVESPGGWRLIGRTPLPLYNPGASPPVRLRAGDYVRFQAISASEYAALASQVPDTTTTRAGTESFPSVAEVSSGGLLTTVQDLGRHGMQQFGVPVAGAMDEYAFRVGNLLVGNAETAAGLEITLAGPVLRFTVRTCLAITGGDLCPCLNGTVVPMWTLLSVEPGDILTFSGRRSGCRAYLALAGGIRVPSVMGSRSTYLRGQLGGLDGRSLRAGDSLPGIPAGTDLDGAVGRTIPGELIPEYPGEIKVRVLPGPQDDHFPAESWQVFLGSSYQVGSESDRMGYRLDGPTIRHQGGADIISDGLPLGAIQVPGHGSPIVMLADRQTTGGYAKMACVIGADLPKLAQLMPGNRISFVAVGEAEARLAWLERESSLARCRNLTRSISEHSYRWRLNIDGIGYDVLIEEKG
jgi:KipI family sensor histidine kinase inhibitor